MNKNNHKIIVAVSSTALFNLKEESFIYETKGLEEYQRYQEDNLDKQLEPGPVFSFIKKLLEFNNIFPKEQPIEVILFSRNSQETGLRIFKSIASYGLDISRAVFFSGDSPVEYIKAFNVSLFLSTNLKDVRLALQAKQAAGLVGGKSIEEDDDELRIAFDYDGVIIDDSEQKIFNDQGADKFNQYEIIRAKQEHSPGPLKNFIAQLSSLCDLELKKERRDEGYKKRIKIVIVTARAASTHQRLNTTIKLWGLNIDQVFFLAGKDKKEILETLRPHLYCDDQYSNLENVSKIPLVYIPFGSENKLAD